jgi:uncharacterized protein YjdB
MAHTTAASTINTLVSDLCNDLGTIVLSAPSSGSVTIAGTTYNGITKIAGSGSSGTTSLSSNSGFYALASGATTIVTQYSDTTYMGGGHPGGMDGTPHTTNYTTNSNISITAAYNGSGTITFVVTVDVAPDIGSNKVNSGTSLTVTVTPPETTNLTNTWGTPSISVPNI